MQLNYPHFLQLNQLPRASLLAAQTPGDSIPKLIHQTFHNGPWPKKIHENIFKLKQLNPGWTYRFYDDDDVLSFINSEYGSPIIGYYKRLNAEYGAARADFFRYLVMYKYGGVYLDIKATADKPLDNVLTKDDRYLLSVWENRKIHLGLRDFEFGEFQQWHIVTVPGHPFLKAVIEYVCRNIDCYVPSIHGYGAFATVRVTGPFAYTLAINRLVTQYPHRFVDAEHDLGFQYSIFDYSIFDCNKARSHEKILGSHYSTLKSPLVKISLAKKLAFLPHRLLKSTAKAVLSRFR